MFHHTANILRPRTKYGVHSNFSHSIEQCRSTEVHHIVDGDIVQTSTALYRIKCSCTSTDTSVTSMTSNISCDPVTPSKSTGIRPAQWMWAPYVALGKHSYAESARYRMSDLCTYTYMYNMIEYYIIVFNHSHHWAAVVSRGWANTSEAVFKLACLVLSFARSCRSSIGSGRLSTAWLVSLVVFYCRMVSKMSTGRL